MEEFPSSFLPGRISRAADHAMNTVLYEDEVRLEQDAAMRAAGIRPTGPRRKRSGR